MFISVAAVADYRPAEYHEHKPQLRALVLDSLADCSVGRVVVVVGHGAERVTKKLQSEEPDLVLDFVGYDDPDHFIGDEPLALEVMKGRPGRFEHPGSVRRIRVAPGAARARNEVLAPGNFEWPRVDDRLLGRRNRWGYTASARGKRFFWNAVARIDFESGNVERFDFGDRVFTSEPVFVPDPERSAEEAGWLLVELYDGDTKKSSLAVLDASRIGDGPLARILLEHHVPISFHGFWKPGA